MDTDKLKRLAEKTKRAEKVSPHKVWHETLDEYRRQTRPDAILALIAENERLKRRVASGSQSLKAARQIGVNAARNMSEALKERDEAVALLRAIPFHIQTVSTKAFLARIDSEASK